MCVGVAELTGELLQTRYRRIYGIDTWKGSKACQAYIDLFPACCFSYEECLTLQDTP